MQKRMVACTIVDCPLQVNRGTGHAQRTQRHEMSFDLGRYLARIDHEAAAPSPAALAGLQAAQLAAIPFENIGPFLGGVPDLAPQAIWKKLVDSGRGGYCLELNALFGDALKALGYDARPVLGRVRMGAATGGPRAHLAHVVRFGDREFLADVGFGGAAPEAPVEIAFRVPVEDRLGRYRMRADTDTAETVLERATPDGWFALYGFDRVPVTAPDCVAANFFCARFPASPFPSHLMLHRVTAAGRVSLFDQRLTTPEGEIALQSKADLAEALREKFLIPVSKTMAARIWRRLAPLAEAA